MTGLRLAVLLGVILAAASPAQALDPYAGIDPWWVLLHEPAVVADLKLEVPQQAKFLALRDRLDLRFWPLRNKSRDEATKGFEAIVAEARRELPMILRPAQSQRLNEIVFWKLGTAALVRDDLAVRMRYMPAQRKRVQEILDETQAAVTALEQEANEGEPREALEKKYVALKTDEQKDILKLLKPEQRKAWQDALGKAFDSSKLGVPEYRVPELIDTGEWINSHPLKLSEQRGKVVIVHFYTYGCINCIRNFPWYREWSDRFKDQDVLLLGIHTPETAGERDIARVRQKAADDKFEFPVLIDPKSENWNAWGNAMWPSVYVIDKRGYMRSFWPGELKWKGTDGEKFMRERIEALRAE